MLTPPKLMILPLMFSRGPWLLCSRPLIEHRIDHGFFFVFLPFVIFSANYDIFPDNNIFTDMTFGARRVWPAGRLCLLLLGTWSYFYLFGGQCCSGLKLYFVLWISEKVHGLLLSFFFYFKVQTLFLFVTYR